MLDKSIPHHDIIMKLPYEDASFLSPILPDGYRFCMYAPGFAAGWAETECSVLEFDDAARALSYFERTFLPHESELLQRMVFVLDASNTPVANACLWEESSSGRVQSCLHWVAVRPAHQGLGLGRAVVMQTLALAPSLAPGLDIYLHTQTWSHPAIQLYHTLGFRLLRRGTFGDSRNQYDDAVRVLACVLAPASYAALIAGAIDA